MSRVQLLLTRLRARAAGDRGFGMIELLIAMAMLSVAVGALMLSFASSAVSLRRAGQKGTALTLADTQMERYRTRGFTGIRIDGTLIPTSGTYVTAHASGDHSIPPASFATCGPYTPCADQAVAGQNDDEACPTTDEPPACLPVRNVTGPDGRAYRIETYVNYVNNDSTLSIRTPASGLTLKRVTVVVRAADTDMIMAREQSAFEGGSSGS
jgi:prepilin-type N-terminal cleavage/methylation domain-containing protein